MTTARELLKEADIGDVFEIDNEDNAKVIRSSEVTSEDLKIYNCVTKEDVIINNKALRYIKTKTIANMGLEREAKIIMKAEKPIIVNGEAYI